MALVAKMSDLCEPDKNRCILFALHTAFIVVFVTFVLLVCKINISISGQ